MRGECGAVAAERHPFPAFPWKPLRRSLKGADREAIAGALRSLLAFERTLGKWPRLRRVPDGAPFVSLYARGRLCGCYGADESDGPARLARAFLRAANDSRFGGVGAGDRAELTAQVSYPTRPELLNPELAEEMIELGTDGIALVRDDRAPVLLLPQVARDERMAAADLLGALARKAGVAEDEWREGALYRFRTEDIVLRPDPTRVGASGVDAAAAWLASLIDEKGRVTFAFDPRARSRIAVGEMFHARAAVAIQALDAHGTYPQVVARARTALTSALRVALTGRPVDAWPEKRDAQMGTIALAVMAGIDLERDLLQLAEACAADAGAWHAGQAAFALGARAPGRLWQTCIDDLERHPFAPWTVMAAAARNDRKVWMRSARSVAASLKSEAPYRGGAAVTRLPETALTALAVEALAACPWDFARAAVTRGREFVKSMQLAPARLYGALDERMALGAFSASPVVDYLRCDVTGHAVLALRGSRKSNHRRAAMSSSG
jgi:AMMECR1 domain-containing protein